MKQLDVKARAFSRAYSLWALETLRPSSWDLGICTGFLAAITLIRSKSDHTLCGKSAKAMKVQWQVPVSRPENLPTAKPYQKPLLLWMSAYPMHSTWPNWSMQIPCNRALRA